MRDISHLPRWSTGITSVFSFNGGTWQAWNKPSGISQIAMLCIGAGAGGAGGGATSSGTGATGGAGGGSGAVSRLRINADLVPDILFVNVGAGGAGGGSNASGSAGALSYISVAAGQTSAAYLFLVSGAAAPTAPAVGTTGGTAGTIMAATGAAYCCLGDWTAIAGQAGGGGGANTGAAGTAVTWGGSGVFLSGGAGGGGKGTTAGTDFAGGNITGAGLVPTILGGSAVAPEDLGDAGIVIQRPFSSTGGAGGRAFGGTNATTGGAGGPGAIGSGGGGGGASTTGGAGGRGGDGLVIITAW